MDIEQAKKWRLRTLVLTGVPLSWLLMMVVHEAGHVVGAWLSGGHVERVVLHPFVFSRTDLSHNPAPQLVAWSGPLVGAAVPLVVYWLSRALRWQVTFLLRFFAGFCLIANGAYIGGGSLANIGDAGDLLRAGASIGCLWLFGVIGVVSGLIIWHRLGDQFGLIPDAPPIKARWPYLTSALLAVLIIAELVLS